MKWDGDTKRRTIGAVTLFALSVFAGICGWRAEEKRAAERREAARMVSLQQGDEQEPEEEPDETQLYWELARDMLSDLLLEQESVERMSVCEGHELFDDEWFVGEYRLTDPYRYHFLCGWYDGIQAVPGSPPKEDWTYMGVEKRRAGDYEGYFFFSVWVKKMEHGVELGTDFHQKMFEHVLYETSKEYYEEKAYLAGVSPSENWMWYVPLYDLLGEPVVMVSVTDSEKLEPVFRDACERMHERQELVSGELGQTVRFGAVFDDHSLAWRDKDELEYTDFDKEYWKRYNYKRREQKYDSYMDEQRLVRGYRRWLERYGCYYPAYYLDFHTGYDAEKQDIFRDMCLCREQYVEMRLAKEEAEKEKEAEAAEGTGTEKDTEKEENRLGDTDALQKEQGAWTVEKGDTLWEIARRRYGDGSLWRRIYEENRGVIGEDGNTIIPGQVLEVP